MAGNEASEAIGPDSDPLLKRLMNSKKQDIFHTSGYAGLQSGERMGASSAETFHMRAEVDRARNFVGRYKDSRVMRESRNELPKSEAYNGEQWHSGSGVGRHGMSDQSDKYGLKERMERADRFNPSRLNGRVDGPAQPPARRNPGISR